MNLSLRRLDIWVKNVLILRILATLKTLNG